VVAGGGEGHGRDDGRGEERGDDAVMVGAAALRFFFSLFPAPIFTGLLPSLLAVYYFFCVLFYFSSFLVWAYQTLNMEMLTKLIT
jgi:hypothetical protein